MGMPVSIEVRDHVVDPHAIDRAFGWLRWVDATFSTYRERSEIRRIRRGELAEAGAHPLVREVLERCEALRAETGGYFDARADGLDPSGLVKGWAVDRAVALIEAAGRATCASTRAATSPSAAGPGAWASATRASTAAWPPC